MSQTAVPSPKACVMPVPPPAGRSAPRRWQLGLVDALLCTALLAIAAATRMPATRGDLWQDEASYALAGARGFQANRWDRSDSASDPEKLLRLRHYHPPLTVQLLGFAASRSPVEASLRLPFVAAGCLCVLLVYALGLAVLAGPDGPASPAASRWAAFLCGLFAALSPPMIRAGSHALPWALITLWLLALLWALIRLLQGRHVLWGAAAGAALGGLFATSEYFLPAILASLAAAVPAVAVWTRGNPPSRRRGAATAALGAAGFLVVAWTLWPAGLSGAWLTVLSHYARMADDPWPVVIEGVPFERAPRWAYLHWYSRLFLPAFLYWCAGLGAMAWLAWRRRLGIPAQALALYTGVLLAVAHASHIIGPEYLAHAVPFLMLVGGFALGAASARPDLSAWATVAVLAGMWHRPAEPLAGMEPRALQPRWPEAARFLAARWRRGDRALASQYGLSARWHLIHIRGVPAAEGDIEALPESSARDSLVQELRQGRWRFVIVGNPFMDYVPTANALRHIYLKWPVVWASRESPGERSRLVIHERPPRRADPARSWKRPPAHARRHQLGNGPVAVHHAHKPQSRRQMHGAGR